MNCKNLTSFCRGSQGVIFFLLFSYVAVGMPDNALGLLWRDMSADLAVPVERGGLLSTMMSSFSALASVIAALFVARVHLGWLTVFCLGVMVALMAALGLSGSFGLALLFMGLLGLFRGSLDFGCNYYLSRHGSSRQMNLLHGLWGVGVTIGLLLARSGSNWRQGFMLIGAGMLAVLLGCVFLLPVWKNAEKAGESGKTASGKAKISLRFLACGFLILCHNSSLFIPALWGQKYLLECRNLTAAQASLGVTGIFLALTLGRFGMSFLANRLGDTRSMFLGLGTAGLGGALLFCPGEFSALGGLFLLGFGLGPIFPSMSHASAWRFEAATATAVLSLQVCAGVLGACLAPLFFGYLCAVKHLAWLPSVTATMIVLQIVLLWTIDRKEIQQRIWH